MAEQLGDAFVQTPNALRVWLRQMVPPAPVNHSDLVISSDAVKAYLGATPLGAALNADVNWVAAACADYAAAVARAAAPATVFALPAGVGAAIDGLAAQLGQDGTGLRYLLALLVAYPLGALFAAVPGRAAKNALSLVLGLFLAQVVFPGGWAHSALSAGVAYAILAGAHGLRALTGIAAPARWAHVAVFAWMMGYMTAVHLYRLHTDYMGWSLDFSGPQMLLTIKLTALAFNMYDGLVMGDKYRKAIAEGHPLARMYRDRLARAVTSIPDPLSYAGYVYAFTSFFAGPAFEYAEYDRSVREAPFRDAASGALGSRHWGSRMRAAGRKLLTGLIFLGLHMVGGAVFNFDGVLSADMLHGPATSLVYRAGYLWVTLFFVRTKYYFAWLVSEGSSNLAGFGYNSATGEWDGVGNMDVLAFETADSATAASKAWNKNTQSWLGRYCNQRLPKGINMWATYALSAFWHGFYPGYYLFFMSAPLLQNVEKALGAKVWPRVQAAGPAAAALYSGLARLVVPLGLNYLVAPFVALGWDLGVTAWASMYYGGHLLIFAVIALLAVVPAPKGAAPSERKPKTQ